MKHDVWSLMVDFLYIFLKNSHLDEVLWAVLKNAVPEKATALISKEEILNNADFFFISVWVFDNSVYL